MATHRAGREKFVSLVNTALQSDGNSASDVSKLSAEVDKISVESFISEKERHKLLVDAWTGTVEHYIDHEGIDAPAQTRLKNFIGAFSLSQEELDHNGDYFRFTKAIILRELANGELPAVHCSVDGGVSFNLQKGEKLIWVFNGAEYLEDRTYRSYVGGSSGMSVRVAKGLYFRTSAFSGHPITRTQRTVVDKGTVAITSKSIIFAGGSKGFRVPYHKIVSFQHFNDGIGWVRDTASAKLQILVTGDGWFTNNLVAGLAHLDSAVT